MKFYSRSQFASWFEKETKKYVGHSGSWVPPSEYEKAAKLILGKINAHIDIPNPMLLVGGKVYIGMEKKYGIRIIAI